MKRSPYGSSTAGYGASWEGKAQPPDLNGQRYLKAQQVAQRRYAIPDQAVLLRALGDQLHGWRTFVLELIAL